MRIITLSALICLTCLISVSGQDKTIPGRRPNIILILTDDQGIGDVGYLNNPYIKTPNIDRMAREGVVLSNFYVSPVCAPTRASLMTGRYSVRTGVHDTYNGGALMDGAEKTLAEYFTEMKFRTGIFGKWHLGDNYPFRAIDQGFQTSLLFKGGGLGQPGDFANYLRKDSSYFDPVLFYNEEEEKKTSGYCTDVYTDAAISWLKEKGSSPFFLYLSYNAPHTPLQVPRKYYDMYANLESQIRSGNDPAFLTDGVGLANLEQTKRIYGMMSNIDDNIGRLLNTLKEQHQLENTIIIFMSDNGPQQNRFKGGYRGLKGTVYEGGIKVPALVYSPALLKPGKVNEALAHIDLLPTLLDLQGKRQPGNIDGRSFAHLLQGKTDDSFNSRSLFFYWQRGYPELFRNMAIRKGDLKLVGNAGHASAGSDLELYNIQSDRAETRSIGSEQPAAVNELKQELESWYSDIMRSSSLKPFEKRIIIGSANEPLSTLNRNDARGVPVVWEQENVYCYWDVQVAESGFYDFNVHFMKSVPEKGKLFVRLSPYQRTENITSAADNLAAKELFVAKGNYMLEAWYEGEGKTICPFYVEVARSNRNVKAPR